MGFSLKIRWPTLEKQFLWKFRRPLRTFFFSSVGLRLFFFLQLYQIVFLSLEVDFGISFHFVSTCRLHVGAIGFRLGLEGWITQ